MKLKILALGYTNIVHEIIKDNVAKMDSVYEEYIIHLVGVSGLTNLRENKLIESCGVINGKQLYTLVR